MSNLSTPVPRVNLTVRVLPEARAALLEYASQHNMSLTAAVDEALLALRERSRGSEGQG